MRAVHAQAVSTIGKAFPARRQQASTRTTITSPARVMTGPRECAARGQEKKRSKRFYTETVHSDARKRKKKGGVRAARRHHAHASDIQRSVATAPRTARCFPRPLIAAAAPPRTPTSAARSAPASRHAVDGWRRSRVRAA